MARVTRTEEEKRALLERWRASGIGLYRFAKENHTSPKSLREWEARASEARAFLPVRVVELAPRVAAEPLVVELAGVGHRVHVPADFDGVTLRRLVEALC